MLRTVGSNVLKWVTAFCVFTLFLEAEALGAQKLEKKAGVADVPAKVAIIDNIINTTDTGKYAYNGWQWMTEEQDGSVRILKAQQYQMWSEVGELCREYGYNEGIADFYYDNPDAYEGRMSSVGPVCIRAYIDGDEYRYYFFENKMIRRVGPDGTQNNPTTNAFLSSLYEMGVKYRSPGVVVKNGTFELVISSRDQIHPLKDSFQIINENSPAGYYVIDGKTKISVQEKNVFSSPDYYHGEGALSWYRAQYKDKNSTSPLGVFLVYTTGEHIDIIYDTYWWD